MDRRSIEIEIWLTGRLNELRMLGLTGGDTEYDSVFYATFRSVVLFAPPPTRDEAIPFLDEVSRGHGFSMWELIRHSVDRQDELFEECQKRRNESAE